MLKLILPAAAVIFLSACGTTASSLKYVAPTAPTPKVWALNQPVAVGDFDDQREGDKRWLGVIRGGFGNHLKTLEADQPVDGIVKAAFEAGLRARRVELSANASNVLSGRIVQLYADQLVRREGVAEIEVKVADRSGKQRFAKLYKANHVEGSPITLATGVLASIDDLRDTLEKTLSEIVDKALDDPALQDALKN